MLARQKSQTAVSPAGEENQPTATSAFPLGITYLPILYSPKPSSSLNALPTSQYFFFACNDPLFSK